MRSEFSEWHVDQKGLATWTGKTLSNNNDQDICTYPTICSLNFSVGPEKLMSGLSSTSKTPRFPNGLVTKIETRKGAWKAKKTIPRASKNLEA